MAGSSSSFWKSRRYDIILFWSWSYSHWVVLSLLHSPDVSVMCPLVACGHEVAVSVSGPTPFQPGKMSAG